MRNQAQAGSVLPPAAIEAALADHRELAPCCEVIDLLLGRIGMRFSVTMAEALVGALEQRLLDAAASDREGTRAWAEKLLGVGAPTPAWVCARLLARLGSPDAHLAWDACLDALPGVVPEGLLHRSRTRLKRGDGEGAAADLRLALQQPAGYDLWSRAERLERKIRQKYRPACQRQLRLAVLSGKASTALLTPLLRLACFRDGIDVKIYESDYDSVAQEILDPQSGLHAFEPEVALVVSHWRDADLPAFSSKPGREVEALVERTRALVATLRERHACTVIHQGFDLPAHDPYGRMTTGLPGGLGSMLRRANQLLTEGAGDGLLVLDLEGVAARVGVDAWEDPAQWLTARQHPAASGLVPLVEAQVATLRALLGLSKKAVILDLDHTLWGGIVGEDGVEGIELGPPSAAGEAYQDFHRYLKRLRERGVVLAVCSKNNEADARRPFESHPETVLGLDDFVMFVANWDDKVSNIRTIAATLSLGIDSFVFIDDNPVERAWVRSQLPEVAVPELPVDPARYIETLDRGRYFEALTLSDEDRMRHESYRAEVERDELRASTGSLDEFLASLQLVAEHGAFDSRNLPRIAQLVNKTNQFNLTTRRYAEAELRAQAADPSWWTRWFRLRDRFRDNGLIGVLACRPCVDEPGALEIDNWLMSCRVLGRRMEVHMLRTLLLHCADAGVEKLYGRFLPTAKNAQVADLFERMGFAKQDHADLGTLWVLDVASAELPSCPIEAVTD